jgi:flagellar hook-associated protein 2
MSLAIDGLVSGLDTTSLINSLMTIEATPQTLLKNRVTTTQSMITALQGLNSSVASLATLGKKTALPATADLFTATSSASSVTATAATGASAGQLDLKITATAKMQVTVSAAMTTWPASPAVMTIVGSDGTKTEITAASTSLADMATAINASAAGVNAVRVASGTDVGTGLPLYRLQLSSKESGAAGAFQVYRGTAAEVTASTATDLLSEAGAATVATATDASITLWAGTAAEQVVTSSTNSFTGILPGVDVTVSKVEADPVSISIVRDTAGVSKVASDLVASLAAVFTFIDAKSAVSTSTTSTGASKTTAGVFTGNSAVRDVRSQLTAAATAPVDGVSPSSIGITVTRYGTVEYDETKFAAALAADPAKTQAMLQTISSRLADAATSASDKYDGSLTTLITGQQSALRTIDDQIGEWDTRLTSRRSSLERVYSALEVQLSNLNAQSDWLTSQLSALTTSTG